MKNASMRPPGFHDIYNQKLYFFIYVVHTKIISKSCHKFVRIEKINCK